jgi:hypothetical protein
VLASVHGESERINEMPKAHFAQLLQMQVNAKDGRAVLHGKDKAGRNVEVDIGLKELSRACAEAKRGLISWNARQTAGPLEKRAQWSETAILDLQTYAVGILPMETPPNMVLAIDRDMETELSFRLPAENARELGTMLIAESERCKNIAPYSKQ